MVHVPVNAIGKKSSKVFRLPKFSLKVICLGPSAVFVDKMKSGAFVPVGSAMEDREVQYRNGGSVVKRFGQQHFGDSARVDRKGQRGSTIRLIAIL